MPQRRSLEMSNQTTLLPVSYKQKVGGYRDLPETTKPINLTYRITYRNARPNDMNYTFTKDYEYYGPLELIMLEVRYQMGKYGGLKAEAIAGDLHEITNGKD